MLVAGRGGSKDAAYAFASDVALERSGTVPRPLTNIHGWAFWDAIGRPRHVCAPMVEQSELSFRQLCRRYGTTLAFTPMFHARLFLEHADYRAEMFNPELDGNSAVGDRPLFVQFCANQPDTLLSAARLVEAHCDAAVYTYWQRVWNRLTKSGRDSSTDHAVGSREAARRKMRRLAGVSAGPSLVGRSKARLLLGDAAEACADARAATRLCCRAPEGVSALMEAAEAAGDAGEADRRPDR